MERKLMNWEDKPIWAEKDGLQLWMEVIYHWAKGSALLAQTSGYIITFNPDFHTDI